MPKGLPPLWQASAALRKVLQGPVVGFRGSTGRVHGLHVDAGQLLQEIDARAWSLDLASSGGWYGQPRAAGAAKILNRGVHLAILLDQFAHEIVGRLHALGIALRRPRPMRQDVMTCLGLRLGSDRQEELVALPGDVVDGDVDFLLVRPMAFLALVAQTCRLSRCSNSVGFPGFC
jgi:hypothetical protein